MTLIMLCASLMDQNWKEVSSLFIATIMVGVVNEEGLSHRLHHPLDMEIAHLTDAMIGVIGMMIEIVMVIATGATVGTTAGTTALSTIGAMVDPLRVGTKMSVLRDHGATRAAVTTMAGVMTTTVAMTAATTTTAATTMTGGVGETIVTMIELWPLTVRPIPVSLIWPAL